MTDEQEIRIGELNGDDIGRMTKVVDPHDSRRQVVGKLVNVNHVLIGATVHTTLTLEYTSQGETIGLTEHAGRKLLFGPRVTTEAELVS